MNAIILQVYPQHLAHEKAIMGPSMLEASDGDDKDDPWLGRINRLE